MRDRAWEWLLAILFCLVLPLACIAEGGEVIQYLTNDDARPMLDVDGLLEVHVINAASSDSILLRAGGQTMLIDCSSDNRVDPVIRYLTALGVTKLDYAFLTHPHDDHIGGFQRLLSKIPTAIFLRSRLYDNYFTVETTELYGMLYTKGIPVEYVENDTEMYLGDAKLKFMQWQRPKASKNNRSMIIHAQLGERSILLAADLEANGQKAMVKAYGSALSADILKVPHHGIISYRKDFWRTVQPKLAVITNSPKRIQTLVEKVERSGVNTMFTSRGTIIAVTSGSTWQVWQKK